LCQVRFFEEDEGHLSESKWEEMLL
jgi:hypothetical protein